MLGLRRVILPGLFRDREQRRHRQYQHKSYKPEQLFDFKPPYFFRYLTRADFPAASITPSTVVRNQKKSYYNTALKSMALAIETEHLSLARISHYDEEGRGFSPAVSRTSPLFPRRTEEDDRCGGGAKAPPFQTASIQKLIVGDQCRLELSSCDEGAV
jgi:hypothetical protein